jgi:hypothetical protein
MEDLHYCINGSHNKNSEFPRDSVPRKFMLRFLDQPESSRNKIKKSCWDCRFKVRENKKLMHENAKNQRVLVERGESNHLACTADIHPQCSEHPKDKVPKELFKHDSEDPKSRNRKWCKDCRVAMKNIDVNSRIKQNSQAHLNNIELCEQCRHPIDDTNRAVNRNGDFSRFCILCKELNKHRRKELTTHYNNLKLNRIKQQECGYFRCKKLFVIPFGSDSRIVRQFETFLDESGKRYIKIEDKYYPMVDAIEILQPFLELSVLEYDHLTLDEQLMLGIIDSKEKYSPKKGNVSSMSSEESMTQESTKCQLLCIECHVIVTIEREKLTNSDKKCRTLNEKQKYVNNLKCLGCVSCGYKNKKLLRFFDMNHITYKRANISTMVKSSKYSLSDVIEECKRCEVLCKNCHRIHTKKQIELGMFPLKIVDNEETEND